VLPIVAGSRWLALAVTLCLEAAMSGVMTYFRGEGSDGRERLEALFREHEPAVVAYVRRRAPEHAVDDVVAETFLVVWRRLDRVPDPALPWLLGVARRVLADQRRSDRRRRRLDSRLAATQSRALPPAAEPGEDRAITALQQLSEKDREALLLICWEGLTPREAAIVLGEPAGRFRVRLHRAKRRIKTLLAEPHGGPLPTTTSRASRSSS
jgi:RNA polymerase sigma-70 factor (ECF subfamily)